MSQMPIIQMVVIALVWSQFLGSDINAVYFGYLLLHQQHNSYTSFWIKLEMEKKNILASFRVSTAPES